MRTQQAAAIIHIMLRIWQEEGQVQYEEEFRDIYTNPVLTLELPFGCRLVTDWFNEILGEIELHKYILPDNFEICEEPVIYEAIGEFYVSGYMDDWGEYDEDYDFDLHQWSCEADDDFYPTPIKESKYKYIGSTDSQVRVSNNDDPRPLMDVGDIVTLDSEPEVHSWYTKLMFKEYPGMKFNSVSFEPLHQD